MITELDMYKEEAIEEQGYLLQMVMMQYHGCFWKRKANSWGDRISRKCAMVAEEYQRINHTSSNLPTLISYVAWTKIKVWYITRKKKEGEEYIL